METVVHFFESLGGWFAFQAAFERLLRWLPSDAPSTVVELGVWLGRSTAFLGVEILNSGKPVTLVAIDHFAGSPELMEDAALLTLEATCRQNLQPIMDALGERFRLITGDSAGSAALFAEGSVDAVWIDAAHEQDAVAADIDAWWSKLRVGGVMGGDDYGMEGVRAAVRERFGPSGDGTHDFWWVVKE